MIKKKLKNKDKQTCLTAKNLIEYMRIATKLHTRQKKNMLLHQFKAKYLVN